MCTVEPDTVHTPVVSDVIVTDNPDVAVADTPKSASPNTFGPYVAPNETVCDRVLMVMFCVTSVAAP